MYIFSLLNSIKGIRIIIFIIFFSTFNNYSLSDHYIRFNNLANGILDFNTLFDGGNDYNFYTCAGGSCGGSLRQQFKEQIKYLKQLSNQKEITVEIYEEYKSISKNRTNIIKSFIDLINFDKLKIVEKKFNSDCKEFESLFNNKSEDCNNMNQKSLNVSKNLKRSIQDFNFIASKEELSNDNNNKLGDYYNKIKALLNNYKCEIKEINTKIVNLNDKEKERLEKEKLKKQKQEEEKKYNAELKSNFENKTKLFGVQLIDNPKNYSVIKKSLLKEDFAGGFYYKNTTNDHYQRNYNIDVKDIIYSIKPPIINNSFYSYQIISREHGETKIITDIIAKAKLINKGFAGCDEFLNPIKDVLYKKYGFKLREKFNVMTTDDQKIEVVLISDCLIGDTFSPNRYEPVFNADTLHLRLRANISEKQFLELFDIDPSQKNKVDTDNF